MAVYSCHVPLPPAVTALLADVGFDPIVPHNDTSMPHIAKAMANRSARKHRKRPCAAHNVPYLCAIAPRRHTEFVDAADSAAAVLRYRHSKTPAHEAHARRDLEQAIAELERRCALVKSTTRLAPQSRARRPPPLTKALADRVATSVDAACVARLPGAFNDARRDALAHHTDAARRLLEAMTRCAESYLDALGVLAAAERARHAAGH